MKPLALNLSKMKKVASDKDSSTFQHPDGHQFKVAHKPLSAIQRKQIEKMPMHNYADGGDVAQDDDADRSPASSPYQDAKGAPPDEAPSALQSNGLVNFFANDIASLDQPAGPPVSLATIPDRTVSSQSAPAQANAPQSSQTSSMPSVSGSGFDLNSAYQQGQKAITEQQNVAQQLSQSQGALAAKHIADVQDLNKSYQQNAADFQDQQKQLINDYQSQHINPNHYVENMGVPQKIASAIGMILGGAGAGAGRPNPGAEFLNAQINRDIQGQQARIEQSKTILGANQDLYKDNLMAQNQTRVNMNDIYDHQLQQAALNLGTPQARAAADQQHAAFALQNAQLLQQNAIRKTVMDHLQNGGTGLSAIDLAHAGLMNPEEATKEQASVDAQNSGIQQVQRLYGQLGKQQTLANRVANPIQSGANIDALNAEITNAVMGADVSKRLTPESAKLEVLPFHVDLKDNQATVNNKMMGVMDLIKQHNAGMTPNMSRYAPQSLPKYPTQNFNSLEGKTASDSKGNRIVMQNGRWVPYGG